jgi:hypothetical protein
MPAPQTERRPSSYRKRRRSKNRHLWLAIGMAGLGGLALLGVLASAFWV